MVKLTFFGGANEIGGNKVLLEDEGAKIYLDFGESFDFGDDFFYEFLSPRSVNGLEVYFEFGLMPKVKKLYSKAMLEYTDVKYEKSDVDAVFISHSHSDHVNHLAFLDESIPVYIGHGAFKLLEAYRKLYPGLYDLGEHDNMNFFKSGEEIKVKHLTVQPVHVEHSVPGAYGFIIRTSKGAIVYSGDFRLHGPKSEMSREFIKKAREAEPIALLCEGTRMGEEGGNVTEEEVEGKVEKIMRESKGLVMASFSMSNVDRFLSFYEAAKKCGRKLVIDTRFAYILDQLKEKVASLPDVRTDENIQVYYRLAKSCTFCEKDYAPWEREYMNKKVTFKDVSRDAKHLVMHVGFYRLMELVYIRPKNADFIYSMSEHFLEGEENEKQKEVLENWMRHFGVKFHKAHCSGHASKEDLETAIKEINPKLLIPIHTLNAEGFKEFHENVKIPEEGESMQL